MAEQFRTDPRPAAPQEAREALVPVSSPHSTPAAASQPPQRTWPAVLALYFLAPFIAEMLTGSTAPLKWNNVGGVIMTIGLYGSGAVLARELVRRRGLGWSSLALLGAAYGVLEEGLAFQTWFSPTYLNPPDRLRLFEVNWTLALIATTIHVALSIMSSVVIAEALFPQQAKRPWLSQKGFVGITLCLGAIASFNFVVMGFIHYHGKGYVSFGIALLFFVLFLWLGLRRRNAPASAETGSRDTVRPAPHLWTLRLAAFAAAFVIVPNLLFLRVIIPIALVPFVIVAGVDLVSVLLLRRWSKRSNWGARHRLALTFGVMGFFMVFAPLQEFVLPHDGHKTGLTLVNLLALGGLIWLASRTTRWEASKIVKITDG